MRETGEVKLPTLIAGQGEGQTSSRPNVPEAINEVSRLPLQPSGLVESDSMSLIDDSALQLYALMKDASPDNPYEVGAACKCAQQIYNLMKLKFDVLKFKAGQNK